MCSYSARERAQRLGEEALPVLNRKKHRDLKLLHSSETESAKNAICPRPAHQLLSALWVMLVVSHWVKDSWSHEQLTDVTALDLP